MQREVKYPVMIVLRIDAATRDKMVARAEELGVPPSILYRNAIKKAAKNDVE